MTDVPSNFRVWCDGEMHYLGFCIRQNGEIYEVRTADRGGDEYHLRTEAVLMYSTGLTDSEGTEIYEGDIIDHNYSDGLDVVEWCDYSASFDLQRVIMDAVPDALESGEVVGDKYRNTNLLDEVISNV